MASGTSIASLFVDIGADISGLTKGFDEVDKKLNTFEKGFGGLQNAVGTGLKMAAGVGVAAIGAVTAGIGKAITEAGNLEQQAANISAVFGDMAPPVEDVKGLINDLALDPNLVIGIEDAGRGIQMMAQNGLAWDDIAGGVARSTILLANATGTDLATSVDIATNAMGIFGLGVKDMDSVVATFTNAANKSQFGVEDWGYALSNAGPKAAAFGFKLDDLFAAMTLTSSGFSSGMTMGTSWAWMINGLVPNTDKAANAMKELGLITADGANQFFNADGTGKNLTEVIQLLQGAFGKLTTEQQMSYSRTIFGQEAFGALSGVLGMNNDQLAQLIPQMTDFSAVEAGAETRTNTFQSAMGALNDTITAVFVMVGDKFLPIVTSLARTFASFIKENAPAVVEFFGGFAERFAVLITVFQRGVFAFEDGSGILAAFLEVLGMSGDKAQEIGQIYWNFKEKLEAFFTPIAELITRFISWQDVLVALGVVVARMMIPAITAFLGVVGPAIAVFAALVAASALLSSAWENDWLGIRTTIVYVWEIISGIFNSVMIKVAWIVDTFKTKWAELTATNATLGEKLALIWNTLKDLAYTAWQGIVTAVSILLPPFWAKLQEWGKAAWQWISEAAPIAWDKIKAWGIGLWTWVTTNAPKWVQTLGEWGKAAWQWIVEVVPVVLKKLGEWAGAIFRWLGDKLPDFLAMIFEWGAALYEWIGDVIPKAIQSLADFIKGIREKGDKEGTPTFLKMVGEWATKFWKWITDDLIPAVGPAFMKFIGAMVNYGRDLLVAIGNLARELGLLLWEWIVKITPVALQKLGEWGRALWNWISENAPEWANTLGAWATAAWEWIVQASGPALTKLGEWGAALWGWIQDKTPEWLKRLGIWAAAAWQWIVDVTPVVVGKLGEWGAALWEWIVTNAPTWGEKLARWAAIAWEWIRDVAIPMAVQKLGEWGKSLWGWIQDNAPLWREKLGEWARATWEWITNTAIPEARRKLGEWGTMLKDWVTDNLPIWIQKFKDMGRDIIDGLKTGIRDKWDEFTNWFGDKWNILVNKFKNFFGIASPSKLFAELGGNLMLGLRDGINDQMSVVLDALGVLSTKATSTVSGMATAVTKSITDATPQLDNYYKKLLDAKIAALQLASQPTLPNYVTPPVTAPPVLADPNAGGGGMAVVIPKTSTPGNDNYGFKDLSLALNSLTGILDVSDTISDIQTFAAKANAFFTAPGQAPLQGSSAANLAIKSLTSEGVGTLSVNNLLGAIQDLIREIRERGIGSKFNINQAPDASLQQQTELEELVTYLNALYG